jgi:hypothetical protein
MPPLFLPQGWTASAPHFAAVGRVAMRHNGRMKLSLKSLPVLAACALACAAQASDKPVYRCPGTPVLYTDAITAQEAKDKGCRTVETAAITVVPSPRPRTAPPQASSGPRPPEARVDPAEQRARDSDARRILETELRKDESALAAMLKDYNNGEPERLGDERNYQKYLDRVAQMKAAIERKESDIAALKRELSKLPP